MHAACRWHADQTAGLQQARSFHSTGEQLLPASTAPIEKVSWLCGRWQARLSHARRLTKGMRGSRQNSVAERMQRFRCRQRPHGAMFGAGAACLRDNAAMSIQELSPRRHASAWPTARC